MLRVVLSALALDVEGRVTAALVFGQPPNSPPPMQPRPNGTPPARERVAAALVLVH
jgi:hypothetical protein